MSHFTIVTHKQGSAAWHEWRHKGIGASDASMVMGENPYRSADALYNEKRNPPYRLKPNTAMARGTALEPEARRLYTTRTGNEVLPVCLQSTLYDWLRASVDGLSAAQDVVVEIKCGQSAYRHSAETLTAPGYYYGQLQHILAVTGLDSIDYWCYWPGYEPILSQIPRNDRYIKRLLRTEQKFWDRVQQAIQRTSSRT